MKTTECNYICSLHVHINFEKYIIHKSAGMSVHKYFFIGFLWLLKYPWHVMCQSSVSFLHCNNRERNKKKKHISGIFVGKFSLWYQLNGPISPLSFESGAVFYSSALCLLKLWKIKTNLQMTVLLESLKYFHIRLWQHTGKLRSLFLPWDYQ